MGPALPRGLKLEDKLRQAFGPECPELNWALKLEMNAQNMVVAAKDFHIDDDGRLDLDHISVASCSARTTPRPAKERAWRSTRFAPKRRI